MKQPDEFSEGHLIDAFLLEPDPPEPTDEHREQVRQLLLRHTAPALGHEMPARRSRQESGSNSATPGTPRGSVRWSMGWRASGTDRRRTRGLVYAMQGLAVGGLLLLAMAFWWPRPDNPVTNFRQVLAGTGAHAWVHGETTVTTSHGRFAFETWFSPSERLAAMRSDQYLQHTDYKAGMQTSFNISTETLQQSLANPHGEHFGRAFMIALLNDGDLQAAMPFHRISPVTKLMVANGERSLIQYQFQVTWQSNASVGWLTTVLVNAENQRITTWEERHTNGTLVLTRFDYPSFGPRDIYELGAPRQAAWRAGLEQDLLDLP